MKRPPKKKREAKLSNGIEDQKMLNKWPSVTLYVHVLLSS